LMTDILARGLERIGFKVGQASRLSSSATSPEIQHGQPERLPYFDTLRVELGAKHSAGIVTIAEAHRVNPQIHAMRFGDCDDTGAVFGAQFYAKGVKVRQALRLSMLDFRAGCGGGQAGCLSYLEADSFQAPRQNIGHEMDAPGDLSQTFW